MQYLTETLQVMLTHGLIFFICGTVLTLGISAAIARISHSALRRTLLVAAVLVFWMALYVWAASGYRDWRSMPDAPENTFSETAPIALLVVGWLPAAAIVTVACYISKILMLLNTVFVEQKTNDTEE